MSNTYKIYLAGGISGLTYGAATDWRQYVIDRLPPEIQGYSPLRAKTYLAKLGGDPISTFNDHLPQLMSTSRGIMTRDSYDVFTADLLFVNLLDATKASIGTCMEIAWAWQRRIPIVAVMEAADNPHDHPMITEALGYRTPNIDEAIEITKCVLLPVPH